MYPPSFVDGGDLGAADGETLAYMQAAWRRPESFMPSQQRQPNEAQDAGQQNFYYNGPVPSVPFGVENVSSDHTGHASKKRKGSSSHFIDEKVGSSNGSFRMSRHPSDNVIERHPSDNLPPAFVNDYEGEEEIDLIQEDETGCTTGGRKDGQSKMTDFINLVASKGTALMYNHETGNFHVLDGPMFEKEYSALRTTRGKKNQAARDRPFAQMYRAYTMVRGEKWASTGTIFRPKNPKHVPMRTSSSSDMEPAATAMLGTLHTYAMSPPSRADSPPSASEHNYPQSLSSEHSSAATVSGERVMIHISDVNGVKTELSLQHFLDVTGAGAMYMAASTPGDTSMAMKQAHHFGLPGSMEDALHVDDIHRVVGGVWNAGSRGDQAYFFKRKPGLAKFKNGSIVGLLGGEVVGVGEVLARGEGLYMVVSDENVKWKGEPIPTPLEEKTGHWCCFIGQVPVTVDGKVKCGDHIGPRADGSGVGVVTRLGEAPVIGIALENKFAPLPSVVKVLCFAGLNSIAAHGENVDRKQFQGLLDKACEMERRVSKVEGRVSGLETRVSVTEDVTDKTAQNVRTLEEKVITMERMIEEQDEARAQVGVGVGSIFPGKTSSSSFSTILPARVAGMEDETKMWKKHKKFVGIVIFLLAILIITLTVTLVLTQGGSGGSGDTPSTVVVVNTEVNSGGGGSKHRPGGDEKNPPIKTDEDARCQAACGHTARDVYSSCAEMQTLIQERRTCSEEHACCSVYFDMMNTHPPEYTWWGQLCGGLVMPRECDDPEVRGAAVGDRPRLGSVLRRSNAL